MALLRTAASRWQSIDGSRIRGLFERQTDDGLSLQHARHGSTKICYRKNRKKNGFPTRDSNQDGSGKRVAEGATTAAPQLPKLNCRTVNNECAPQSPGEDCSLKGCRVGQVLQRHLCSQGAVCALFNTSILKVMA